MDLTAFLTDAELESLSNYDTLSIHDAIRTSSQNMASGVCESESDFEKSFRVKNTLDLYERRIKANPSTRGLAVLINGECLLWAMNKDTSLQHNPFLSHWVEAVQRLDAGAGQVGDEGLSAERIGVARALCIKMLLQGEDVARSLEKTPRQVSDALLGEGLGRPFDLNPYIRMLQEEGIYEKPLASPSSAHPQVCNAHGTTARKTHSPAQDSTQKRKDDILHQLETDSNTAIFNMTRLPISLGYLDFLTKILTDHLLEKYSIDPAPVISQFIQHALRTVERIATPPLPPDPNHQCPNTDTDADADADMCEFEYGKEAQTRYIRLLLLFIRNLMRKELVGVDALFYEISEIVVRYVWIKEVREFRCWAERGLEVGEGEGEGD